MYSLYVHIHNICICSRLLCSERCGFYSRQFMKFASQHVFVLRAEALGTNCCKGAELRDRSTLRLVV